MKLPAILENRRIGAAVLAGCVLISVFGMGTIKLSGKRAQAQEVFYSGTDTSLSQNHSMSSYLERAAGSADKFAEEAELLLGEGSAAAVTEKAEQLRKAEDIGEKYAVYTGLCTAVESLWTDVLKLENADTSYARTHYKDFQSAMDLISRDGYGDAARSYNRQNDGIPASLIGTLFGLGDLDTFGE